MTAEPKSVSTTKETMGQPNWKSMPSSLREELRARVFEATDAYRVYEEDITILKVAEASVCNSDLFRGLQLQDGETVGNSAELE
ncbi:hypothetical protein KIN20_031317 [Parelaphostrongylus tenuis]|uniref:Uncharacterized protein n=1 Tax=Parelaphostrongylus tenuis TaxID=148309 RepID=A0AAD5R4Y3_PARTN|nr:hypothetical protein KIN20_031317 [Parelaphostrongylus tenuis]